MVECNTLVAYCNELLQADTFRDYCPNGLQVEGRHQIKRIITGVTASAALIEQAICRNADLLLVHHGYFWKGEELRIVGMKRGRLRALLEKDLNLVAYHLPLDAHMEVGNNAQLALRFDWSVKERFLDNNIGMIAELDPPRPLAELVTQVTTVLNRPPLVIAAGDHAVRRIAWCSGAAQGYIEQAATQGADAYLSGEVSEQTCHAARELGIHYLAAGHHATERYGVQALGAHLAQHFDLIHEYVEIDNPV